MRLFQGKEAVAAGLCVAMSGLAQLGCRDATQVTVAITTDAACSDLGETSITVGSVGDVEQRAPSTTTGACEAGGTVGSIVIVPSEEDDAGFALRVVSSLGGPADQCVAPAYGPSCIVARRALQFLPHTSLELPIAMREACAGVLCPEDQTCVDGTCRSSTVDCDAEGCGPIPLPNVDPWVAGLGGAGSDVVHDLAVGLDGRVLITGVIAAPADLGGEELATRGSGDAFLASYTSVGLHRWSRSFGGAALDLGASVAVDRAGGVLMLGAFSGVADFGGGELTSRGGRDVALVSLTSWGATLWSVQLGGTSDEEPGEIAIGSDGTLYATGTFTGAMKIGEQVLESSGGGDVFVASFERSGDLRWARAYGGPGEDSGAAIAVGAADDLYLTGYFTSAAAFGSGAPPLEGKGGGDVFIASLTKDGDLRWAHGAGDDGSDRGIDVAVSQDGRVAVTGQLDGPTTLAGVSLGAGPADGFVAVLDAEGGLAWSTTFGTAGTDWGRKVSFDEDGALYLGGVFFSEAVFGDALLAATSPGVQHPLVAAFDPTGKPMWARGFDAGLFANTGGIGPAGGGLVYVAGYFTPDLALNGAVPGGKDALASQGEDDIFLARIGPP